MKKYDKLLKFKENQHLNWENIGESYFFENIIQKC